MPQYHYERDALEKILADKLGDRFFGESASRLCIPAFRPLEHVGYTLVDGGVWANNPTMLAVIEALICFDIGRDQIDVLSLGCGDDPYIVSQAQIDHGGKLSWSDVIFAPMSCIG